MQLAHHRAGRSGRLPGLAHVLTLAAARLHFPLRARFTAVAQLPVPEAVGGRGQRDAVGVIFTLARRPRTNLWGVSSASTESMAAGRQPGGYRKLPLLGRRAAEDRVIMYTLM